MICPGFVADTGMVTSEEVETPRMAGASSPEQVTQAVVRAIRQNLQEVLVNPGPTRLLLALDALSPALGNSMLRRMGLVDLYRPLAESTAEDS